MTTFSKTLEADVSEKLATDPHYPLGELDAMRWAVAFRLIRERNGRGDDAPDDADMLGWFSNAMATAEIAARGGSFLNADGLQSIRDGDMTAHPEYFR